MPDSLSLVRSVGGSGADLRGLLRFLETSQEVLAFTSSITTGLQKHCLGMVKAYEEIEFVGRTLRYTRTNVGEFHRECFEFCSDLAKKLNVDIKKPRTAKIPTKCYHHR